MARAVRRLATCFSRKDSATTPKVLDCADAVCFPLERDLDRGIDAALDREDPIAGGAARLFQRDRRVAADGPPGRVVPSRVAPDQDEGLLASSADAYRQAGHDGVGDIGLQCPQQPVGQRLACHGWRPALSAVATPWQQRKACCGVPGCSPLLHLYAIKSSVHTSIGRLMHYAAPACCMASGLVMDRLPERGGNLVEDDARNDVLHARRRKRHDHLDAARRKGFGEGGARTAKQNDSEAPRQSMIPKSGDRFSGKDHAQIRNWLLSSGCALFAARVPSGTRSASCLPARAAPAAPNVPRRRPDGTPPSGCRPCCACVSTAPGVW